MKSNLFALGAVLVVAFVATAADVPLRDGTVITADTYRITGSYVMIQLPDGSQVAYDVADVDVAALRALEAAAAAESGAEAAPEPQPRTDTVSSGRSLKDAGAAADDQPDGLTISDRDVKHLRESGVQGEDEEQEADTAGGGGPEGGHQAGGSVVLNSVTVSPAGEGRWQVQGEVVNRSPGPVQNVIVKLETVPSAGEAKWSGEVSVSASLGPDDKATFEHSFAAEVPEGRPQPSIRASVMWMQEETRREPDYTKAGGVPHPSNLPLQFGGVAGADVRPTPIQ